MLMFESFAWLDSQYEPSEDTGQELIGFPYRLQAGWVFLEFYHRDWSNGTFSFIDTKQGLDQRC